MKRWSNLCASILVSASISGLTTACQAAPKQSPAQSGSGFSLAHMQTVLGGATVISNPGTPLLVSDSKLEQVPGGYEFRITGEQWSGYYQNSVPIMDVDYPLTITLDDAGDIKNIPVLPLNRLDSALRYFGKGLSDGSDWVLSRLPSGIRVRVLVEFKNPVSEQKLGWDYGSGRFFLSRGAGNGLPLYWGGDIDCPTVPVDPMCDSYSSIDTFRSWVKQLTAADQSVLTKFGISLATLQTVAREGRIYGVIQEASPRVIRRFKDDENVRSLWVVDMWPCRPTDRCP